MGAIVANASEDDQEGMYNFGINLGLAFSATRWSFRHFLETIILLEKKLEVIF